MGASRPTKPENLPEWGAELTSRPTGQTGDASMEQIEKVGYVSGDFPGHGDINRIGYDQTKWVDYLNATDILNNSEIDSIGPAYKRRTSTPDGDLEEGSKYPPEDPNNGTNKKISELENGVSSAYEAITEEAYAKLTELGKTLNKRIDRKMTQLVTDVVNEPVGVVKAYIGAAAPSGWLLCDGTEYDESEYPDLANLLTVTAQKFNVPNMIGRSLLGAGDFEESYNFGDAQDPIMKYININYPLLGIGGFTETSLAETAMPPHDHDMNLGSSSTGNTRAKEGSGPGADWDTQDAGGTTYVDEDGSGRTVDIAELHTNIQPYYVVNYIIKAI